MNVYDAQYRKNFINMLSEQNTEWNEKVCEFYLDNRDIMQVKFNCWYKL